MRNKIIVLILLLGLGGCTRTIDTFCQIAAPISMGEDLYTMEEATLTQIIQHNEKYTKRCN